MYNNLNGYQNIVKNKIESARHETLMVMLYDGMITRIKQARERFEAGQDLNAKSCIVRTMKIADALLDSLNMDENNPTAKDLESLYYFVINELNLANKGEEVMVHLDNAQKVLEILRDGWKKLEEKVLNDNR